MRDWQRQSGANRDGEYHGQARRDKGEDVQNPSEVKRRILEGMRERVTTGWKPTCSCGARVVPCLVLDAFCGSGTTGDVALKWDRRFLGIDVKPDYIEITNKRLTNRDTSNR
jgi:tRNA/tmRNA/rRNA uracil-C5-methylase (TrmA/RlmC/RlmD family)